MLLSVHSTGTHTASPASTAPAAAKIEKVRRPTVSAAGFSEEWSYFLTRWWDYVEATKVTGKDRVVQLLECCEEQLRKDFTRNTGGLLTNKTVDEVMAAITKLAVRGENTMVARVQPTIATDLTISRQYVAARPSRETNHQTPQVVHMVKPKVRYLTPSALQPALTKIGLATSSH